MPSCSRNSTGRTCSIPPFTPTTAFSPAATLPRKIRKARDRILGLADEAVREADWRLGKNPNDVDALFARGWVRSLKCTYLAMVEREFGAGFRLATKAKDDEERVLAVGPELRGREAGGGRLRVRGGRVALALQAADRLCRHHRIQVHGPGHAAATPATAA